VDDIEARPAVDRQFIERLPFVLEIDAVGITRLLAVGGATRCRRPEAEIAAAAAAEPDARPMTEEEFQRARKVPRAKTLRRALGLTQEEFAGRYQIPIGTLRDWEQGRSEPDQPARAYLTVIARDPEGVCRALEAKPG
jgi:putative transcriptional regulator